MSKTVQKKSRAKSSKKSTLQDSPQTKIIPMDWVNFLVFRWICHSDDIDVDDLVAQAVAAAESNEGSSIKEQLELLLGEQVEVWQDEWVGRLGDGKHYSAEDVEPLACPDSPIDTGVGYADLLLPIMQYGWAQISTWAIAEAVLRHKGMWPACSS